MVQMALHVRLEASEIYPCEQDVTEEQTEKKKTYFTSFF